MARSRPTSSAPARSGPSWLARRRIPIACALLLLHATLALWVARENSVTFDESFHVPAGVRILRHADFATSYAQPPLPKSLYAAAALAAGAREPDARQAGPGRERFVGYTFMRANADRFTRVYGAARVVAVLMSVLMGIMIWRAAQAWHGPEAGLVALAIWCVLPESLAHGSVAGVDIPTAITFFGATLAWIAFVRSGSWGRWGIAAAWVAAAFLSRFSAVQLGPMLLAITAFAVWRGQAAVARRAWIGLLLLPLVAWIALDAGYLFQVSMRPWARWSFQSGAFQALQNALPWLRLPLPDAWIEGVDYLSLLAQPGAKQSYLLGHIRDRNALQYFPVAIAVKWPLGLLALGALAKWTRWRERRARPWTLEEVAMLVAMTVVLLSCMLSNLDYGVRYALPLLPFLCVWIAGLLAGQGIRRLGLVLALVAAIALESARALPYPLAFFNTLAGGPGRGDRIVNDSNVDWGQGLVALRRDMQRLGIRKVHLAYHGTVDPAIYGIDYEIFTGGDLGAESDWLAVSSYFFVGLPARLTTFRGMSEQPIAYDLSVLRNRDPAARPAGCMYLFRIR